LILLFLIFILPHFPLLFYFFLLTAVEQRDRKQVEQSQIQADHRHQAGKREPAELRRLTRQLRDADRAHQLSGRGLAGDESPQCLDDQPRISNVIVEALLDRPFGCPRALLPHHQQ